MVTLNSLKRELRQRALATTPHTTQPLSDAQYSAGLDILMQNSGRAIYDDFIAPQLRLLLSPLCHSRSHISVLEIGPGAKSVLGSMPSCVRRKIKNYAAFEPNHLFATRLEEWLCSTSETGPPLPCLDGSPKIHRVQFSSDGDAMTGSGLIARCTDEKFDVVLFCHSMYGMQPKRKFIERALQMMKKRPEGGLVVVFHRNGELHFDGLTCHRIASFPTGIVEVADNDEALDRFAPFVAGFFMQDANADQLIRIEWREVCRALGRHDDSRPGRLLYSAPDIMVAFTQDAIALPELTAEVPVARESKVKNQEARLHQPASILRPTEIRHIQDCVCWALNHGVSLTVISGGHSGHCIWPNVVAVDMSAFSNVHILNSGKEIGACSSNTGSLVVAEAGCKSGDIVRKTTAAGLIVPMGSRPSVGAGLWLQGGIGHLSRLHGLTCDAIVGAVMVSVASSKAFYIGHVPTQYRPPGALRHESQDDLLWALKGAGTNFGIVVSVTFKAYPAPMFSIHDWVLPLNSNLEARAKLSEFVEVVAADLPRNVSADAYLYWDRDKLHLGVTMFESSANVQSAMPALAPASAHSASILGPQSDFKTVDSVGLFESEMYVSGMHGGHGGGKTSSFKRCLFLKRSGILNVIDILVAAIETRPSPLCYFHLLHGGGAVGDVADDATAFGCRDWDFACVITGVWPRNQDGMEIERAAVQWVYNVVWDLLPLSSGVYGADLGPDTRDNALAAKAFGLNRPRLSHLKYSWDPSSVLAHTCPLLEVSKGQKLVVLVTGESCAGKDFCADIWVSMFATHNHNSLRARSVSISDAIKKEYAVATGANITRLLSDRAYKEKHRSALSMYFRDRMGKEPRLREAQFLDVVNAAADMDVLFITGMRDEVPVAAFSHLVPEARLVEVRVTSSMSIREVRRGCQGSDGHTDDHKNSIGSPCLIFNNDMTGPEAVKRFCKDYLLPFFHEDMERLASMVRSVPDFPRPGVEFRHVLDISQQSGGLALCTSLLQERFTGTWADVTAVACCEVGGFVYASALAARVGVPLALIREAGKLPPPTISVMKPPSHISSATSNDLREKRIEMGRDVIPRGGSVLVVDDVLATGETLCAVLQLLGEVGVGAEDVSVLVVAEFPFHRGRELLRCRGFGRARIQSLLVFGGI